LTTDEIVQAAAEFFARHGDNAVDAARERVRAADQLGDVRGHDFALLLLTEVERLAARKDG
jgi:NAD(P)-dependent dehydrogenase (short-subunit alcohol dehydrogenase family)